MADMLGKPYGGWTCRCCWDGSKFQGQNRKHDERQWQRDVEAGEHSKTLAHWVSRPEELNDPEDIYLLGSLGEYMHLPEPERDPWDGFNEYHNRPFTLEEWEEYQQFMALLEEVRQERLQHAREERRHDDRS